MISDSSTRSHDNGICATMVTIMPVVWQQLAPEGGQDIGVKRAKSGTKRA